MSKQLDALKYRRPTCCYSRAGFAKHIYNSRAEAMKHDHGQYEAYECQEHPGKWHLRTPKVAR